MSVAVTNTQLRSWHTFLSIQFNLKIKLELNVDFFFQVTMQQLHVTVTGKIVRGELI